MCLLHQSIWFCGFGDPLIDRILQYTLCVQLWGVQSFDIFPLPEASHFRPSYVFKCSICSKCEYTKNVGAYFNILTSKCPGLESGETSVEKKKMFQPAQLILIVTMQKIHNVDNALLMFFSTGSNLFAWGGKTRHQYDFHFKNPKHKLIWRKVLNKLKFILAWENEICQ